MEFYQTRKEEYFNFVLSGEWSTQECLPLKRYLSETLEDPSSKVSIDLQRVTYIDSSGWRFLDNVNKVLSKNERKLVLYGMQGEIKKDAYEKFSDSSVLLYDDLYEFEQTFHVEQDDNYKKYFRVAVGDGSLRSLTLGCPICNHSGIVGYLHDEEAYELAWDEKQITPQWKLKENVENQIDRELYEVVVCPKCFFATNRIDHFEVTLPEGKIPSILTQEQKDRIVKGSSSRVEMLTENYRQKAKTFFSLPREPYAGRIAWELYDRTLRDIANDKASTHAIEVARSSILMAKYSTNRTDRENAFTTAQVWLSSILNNQNSQLTHELVQAYVYYISVSLAMDRKKDAFRAFEAFRDGFENSKIFEFWYLRGKELVAESKGLIH